jgi:hypothetical protein
VRTGEGGGGGGVLRSGANAYRLRRRGVEHGAGGGRRETGEDVLASLKSSCAGGLCGSKRTG